jgi:phosphoglycolate phosphatase-like HAD superfamily hydrolase
VADRVGDGGARFAGAIFDFDGTVADTLPICIEAFQHTFERYGGPQLDAAGVRSLFGPTEEGVLATALGADADAALETYLDEYTRLHYTCPAPFPGIRGMLDTLRNRGVPLAIVTGKGPRSVRISLDYVGLGGYFDPVEAGSPRGTIKGEAMTRVAAAWGMAPGRIVSIGDHRNDINEARKAGTVPVSVVWAHPESADLLRAEGPEALFETVEELAAWLLLQV